MKTKKIKTNSWVILEGKQIPPGTILTIGKEIDEKQAETLLSMGKEISLVGETTGQPEKPEGPNKNDQTSTVVPDKPGEARRQNFFSLPNSGKGK